MGSRGQGCEGVDLGGRRGGLRRFGFILASTYRPGDSSPRDLTSRHKQSIDCHAKKRELISKACLYMYIQSNENRQQSRLVSRRSKGRSIKHEERLEGSRESTAWTRDLDRPANLDFLDPQSLLPTDDVLIMRLDTPTSQQVSSRAAVNAV